MVRKFTFRRLEQRRTGGSGDTFKLAYDRPRTSSGKVYQFSPNTDAAPRLFLLGDGPEEPDIAEEQRGRMRRSPGAGDTICPYSGFIAHDEEFEYHGDVEAVRALVEWEAASDIHEHFAEIAKDFNRGQRRGSFLSTNMEVDGGPGPRPNVLREDLLRNLECDVCARSYGVYAIALFCPDCGAPNLHLHFDRELELVAVQIQIAEEAAESGEQEIAYRLVGNAHEDVLTAFETTLKTVYRHLIRTRIPERFDELAAYKVIRNSFQNIQQTQDRFDVLLLNPYALLDESALSILRLNIQKRHVIGHNLGVADERYTDISGEGGVGETIDVIGTDVLEFGKICRQVVDGLDGTLLP